MPNPTRTLSAAFLVFLIFSSIYITTVVKLDDTNIGTTNGLWKSPMIASWEKGADAMLDNGEWLYGPLYGRLCRLIPDRWVSYGTPGPVVTFRKMAILNSLFSGLASAIVFLIAMRLLGRLIPALIVGMAHGCAAFIIVNSVNSEDIIPAYTFFVLMTLCLIAYLQSTRIVWMAAAGLCCAMLTLLHWTLMIPAIAGIGIVGLFLLLRDSFRQGPPRFWMLPVFFGIFFFVLELFVGFFGHVDSIRLIVYPAKAGPSGYLGFHAVKFIYAAIGIGNYFMGGWNIGDYRSAFDNPVVFRWMRISWAFAICTIAPLVWVLFRRGSAPLLRMVCLFGLAVFGMGQLEHLYSQPQDPQSQIQPMFASILGLMVLFEIVQRATRPKVSLVICLMIASEIALTGARNGAIMLPSHGDDSVNMKRAIELANAFPPSSTVIVSHGFEGWNTWIFAETFGGRHDEFSATNIALVNGILDHPGMAPDEAADLMTKQIAAEMAKGRRVVTNVIWVGSKEDFAFGLSSLVDVAQARAYTDRLAEAFHAGRSWETSVGKFVELTP